MKPTPVPGTVNPVSESFWGTVAAGYKPCLPHLGKTERGETHLQLLPASTCEIMDLR